MTTEARRIYGECADLPLREDPCVACRNTDTPVICTEWRVFRNPELDRLQELLRRPLIIDGCNLYDPLCYGGWDLPIMVSDVPDMHRHQTGATRPGQSPISHAPCGMDEHR